MKNYSKLLQLLLLLALCVCLVACVTSCGETSTGGDDNTEGSGEGDEGGNGGEGDNGNDGDGAQAAEVSVTVTVKDQDGECIASAKVILSQKGAEVVSGTTDAEGKFSAKVKEGSYSATVEQLPEGYLADSLYSVSFSQESVNAEITVINNIPNGTEARPFHIVDSSTSVTVPAKARVYYSVHNANGKIFTLTDGAVSVTVGENTYAPDADGNIEFVFSTNSSRDSILFCLANDGDADEEVSFTILSPIGAMDNPYDASLSDVNTVKLAKDATVYFGFTATKNGFIVTRADCDYSNISIINNTKSTVSNYTDGERCAYLRAEAGDTILIAVSLVTDSSIDKGDGTVGFTVEEIAGSASEPLALCQGKTYVTLPGGEYFFAFEPLGTLRIKAEDITVSCSGAALTPDDNGVVTIDTSALSDTVIKLVNSGDQYVGVSFEWIA